MRLFRVVKIFVFGFISTFTLFSFQNCSKGFKVSQQNSEITNSLLSAPQISFDNSPDLVNTSSVSFSFQASGASAATCSLNSGSGMDCSSKTVSYSNLTDGDYTLEVIATTSGGISSQGKKNFRKDSTAPVISVTMAPSSSTTSTSASFIFSVTDNLSGVALIQCSLDNAAFATCISPVNLSGLSVSSHNFRIQAQDRAGNMSAIYSYNWTVTTASTPAPSVFLASAPSSLTNSTSAAFTFTGQNAVSFECALDNAVFSICSSPASFSNLTAGSHSFRVQAVSSTGTRSTAVQASWSIDLANPSAPDITSSVGSLTNQASASFNFVSTDANGISRYECSQDAGTYASCTSPRSLSGLNSGSHSLAVRSVDNAGNTSGVSIFTWSIDTTLPTLSFSQTPAVSTTGTSATFAFSATDANGINLTQCSLDYAVFSSCTSPQGFASLAVASHNFRVQVRDGAGNVSLISHSWTVTAVTQPPTDGSVLASLSASRLSGPAPLAVHFDASGTTATNVQYPFHDLTYDFNFGDDRGLTWAISNLPKNTQSGGPIAAHVFDNPGIYTVTVRARRADGAYNDATVQITVLDPNVVYSGTNTICVSTSANYSGCPTGALNQTALPTNYENKRVLLRRGEVFGTITINHANDNVMITGFGTGNKPRVNRVSLGEFGPLDNTDFPDEIIIMDLDIANGIGHMASGSRFLIYRNDLDDAVSTADNTIAIGGALGYVADNNSFPASSYYHPREIFLVENRVLGTSDSDQIPYINLQAVGSRFVILGNEMGGSYEHTIRMFSIHKGFISHNWLRGTFYSASGPAIRLHLKIHSAGLQPYNDSLAVSRTYASAQTIISNNRLGSTESNGSWTTGAAPQNTTSTEGMEDFIFENNLYYRGQYTNTEALVVGRRMNARGNTRADGQAVNINNGFGNIIFQLPAEWLGPYFGQIQTQ